jgi:hypothetical protein
METSIFFCVIRNSRKKYVVRKWCMNDGIPSVTDLKSFSKKPDAEQFKKEMESETR